MVSVFSQTCGFTIVRTNNAHNISLIDVPEQSAGISDRYCFYVVCDGFKVKLEGSREKNNIISSFLKHLYSCWILVDLLASVQCGYNPITNKCGQVLFKISFWLLLFVLLKLLYRPTVYSFHDHVIVVKPVKSNDKVKWWVFFVPYSFSTAYQCIYYSPEHTAKAQEVLSTMSLLQPLITSLADQLLQAAKDRSSTGLRDALKTLSDKVRQSSTPPSISLIPLFLSTSGYCNTQSTYFILEHHTLTGNASAWKAF